MNDERLRITTDALDAQEDRFDRFRRIGWWDQSRLARARLLVIGAGALGNELIKNLALLGAGNLMIADLDSIENSNLSRSVLYREQDNGQPKAKVAAAAAKSIYPDLNAHYFHGNVIHDLGVGVFRWADLVLGGLDNREARLAINRYCWKVNRPWIDGAIEQIQGCVRFFQPDGPCYECTMSERDWKILQQRRSCNLLTRHEMEQGRTPTTPTISSIIAGVQCQEAVKHLHGLPTMQGRGWIFEGLSGDSYPIQYQRKAECYSHETLEEVVPLAQGVNDVSVAEMLAMARDRLGESATIEFAREMLERFVCPACGEDEFVFASLGTVRAAQAACPRCDGIQREALTFHRVDGSETFLDRSLYEIGVPPFDIVFARSRDRLIGFELSGDSRQVLGELAGDEEAVEWS